MSPHLPLHPIRPFTFTFTFTNPPISHREAAQPCVQELGLPSPIYGKAAIPAYLEFFEFYFRR